MDRIQARHPAQESNLRFQAQMNVLEARRMAAREATTEFERQRLQRELQLRDINAAITISNVQRAHN